jgi:hypothetical protein
MATQTHPQDRAAEHLAIVLGALQDLGVPAPRPAPRRSLAFVPRQLRVRSRYTRTSSFPWV